jgi:hypothetical protein
MVKCAFRVKSSGTNSQGFSCVSGSNTADKYLHWLFMTPIDEKTTRCFFVFLLGPLEIPLINKPVPKFLRKTVIHIANFLHKVMSSRPSPFFSPAVFTALLWLISVS